MQRALHLSKPHNFRFSGATAVLVQLLASVNVTMVTVFTLPIRLVSIQGRDSQRGKIRHGPAGPKFNSGTCGRSERSLKQF
jgi:hypothetical protein